MTANRPHAALPYWITQAIISPAYGHDYRSADAAIEAFLTGKDFMLHTPLQYMGRYCSVRDFAPGAQVMLRYGKMRKVVPVRVPAEN